MVKKDKIILSLIIGPVLFIIITMTIIVVTTWQEVKPVQSQGTSSNF